MKAMKITGWVLSVLIVAMLLFSASFKLRDFDGKEAEFAKMGWEIEVMKTIGIVEIAVAILYLVPRTAFIGAVLITAYLGGAIATHVHINDQFFMPIIIGVIVWVALGLRDGRIFTTAFTAPEKPLAA